MTSLRRHVPDGLLYSLLHQQDPTNTACDLTALGTCSTCKRATPFPHGNQIEASANDKPKDKSSARFNFVF